MKPRQISIDLETVPDLELARTIYPELCDMEDAAAAEKLGELRGKGGGKFLPTTFHKIVAGSVTVRDKTAGVSTLDCFSLGASTEELDEIAILRDLDQLVSTREQPPTLITWNGYSFDFAVVRYRAMHYGVSLQSYWDIGQDGNRDKLYGNYFNRYHWEHVDLMDMLAGYLFNNNARLTEMAMSCGLPGKIGVGGGNVWSNFLAGNLEVIRDYCDVDTMLTYLLWLRWEQTRGMATARFEERVAEALEFLHANQDVEHWQIFLADWNLQRSWTFDKK